MRKIILLVVMAIGLPMPAIAADRPGAEHSSAIGVIAKMPEGTLSKPALDALMDIGKRLFTTKFNINDGAGRPGATQAIVPTVARNRAAQGFARLSGPDSNSCAACHNDPGPGGAGDFVTNVFAAEGFANADFDTSDPQFSNERGTTHLFGAGLVELLAREMSQDLRALRTGALRRAAKSGTPVAVDLKTKGVSFGVLTAMPDGLVDLTAIDGVDTDLVIRPFSQKGVITSLRQFTINAMNQHHGMQATERFGARWTGTDDFDDDGKSGELGEGDISALVAWQTGLPNPVQVVPDDSRWKAAAAQGAKLMTDFGCQVCHRAALPLKSLAFSDPGPLDASGTLNSKSVKTPAIYDLALLAWTATLPRNDRGEVLVPLFGDLKRHKMTDRTNERLGNELLAQRFVDRNIFMTAELWGVGSTAPYGHRNDITTLDEIILAHGGEAKAARDRYQNATETQRTALIGFLQTLNIRP